LLNFMAKRYRIINMQYTFNQGYEKA